MCIPAPAITCVRTHHAQYQKKTNESFWYCAWCLRTHVIAGAGRHFPVLLPPSTLHTRQKVLKTEQIWTSIRGWTKSKILVRKTTRRRERERQRQREIERRESERGSYSARQALLDCCKSTLNDYVLLKRGPLTLF